ncbi:MAG TPA: prepilin peptidase [Acidimicrobiales bacterium]|nr:prepilin peptidase [Acidimicrobiales bacterium]
MTYLLVGGCSVLGLAVGSFLNVVIHRVPRKESVVRPPSRCPGCGSSLAVRDNIPVVSWLLLRGRCRACREPISARYPLVEVITGVLFGATAARLGADWALPAFLVVVAGLIAISAVDLARFIVPNRILYPTLFLAAPLLLAAAAADGDWSGARTAAIGGVLGFGLLLIIHLVSPAGMGFGDVRLAGLIGMTVGWLSVGEVLVALFLAFLLAAVLGVGLILVGVKGRKDKVPFGPFLAGGAMLAIFFGAQILDWYSV